MDQPTLVVNRRMRLYGEVSDIAPLDLRYFGVTLALAVLGLRGDQGRTDKRARTELPALLLKQGAQQRKEAPGEAPYLDKTVKAENRRLVGNGVVAQL